MTILAHLELTPREIKILRRIIAEYDRKLKEGGIDPILSDREHEVLILLASGRSYRQISEHCKIAHRTVVSHANAIYQKLHAQNSCHAVALALDMQLIYLEEIIPIISRN